MSVFHINLQLQFHPMTLLGGRACVHGHHWKNLIYAYTEHARIRGVGVGWVGELRGIIVFGGEGGGRGLYFPGGGGGVIKKIKLFFKTCNTCKHMQQGYC